LLVTVLVTRSASGWRSVLEKLWASRRASHLAAQKPNCCRF
jgi:hypothetical protein